MRWCCALVILGLAIGADAQDLGDDTMIRGAMSRQAIGDSFIRPNTAVTCGAPPSAALSFWLSADNVDGSSNSTLANNDPIGTWSDRGTIGDSPAQGTASAKPTFITGCISGRPCVRFDGGDWLRATTAANFTFMSSGAGATVYVLAKTETNANMYLATTRTTGSTSRGSSTVVTTTFRGAFIVNDGTASQISLASANNAFTTGLWHRLVTLVGNHATPGEIQIDGSSVATGGTATFSASAPAQALEIGAAQGGTQALFTGDMAQMLIYSAEHDATARAAVTSWLTCLYGTTPQ